jgi:hypothetical protein
MRFMKLLVLGLGVHGVTASILTAAVMSSALGDPTILLDGGVGWVPLFLANAASSLVPCAIVAGVLTVATRRASRSTDAAWLLSGAVGGAVLWLMIGVALGGLVLRDAHAWKFVLAQVLAGVVSGGVAGFVASRLASPPLVTSESQ